VVGSTCPLGCWTGRARATDERIGNVVFEQGDAQVHPFAKSGFEVAVSRGGVMFC
jgi:hypothetical protein